MFHDRVSVPGGIVLLIHRTFLVRILSYNRVNGTHAPENRHLLQDILRNEWKFDGLIMSDWYECIDLS